MKVDPKYDKKKKKEMYLQKRFPMVFGYRRLGLVADCSIPVTGRIAQTIATTEQNVNKQSNTSGTRQLARDFTEHNSFFRVVLVTRKTLFS